MGFDISYHPISEQEINEWYFDVLENDSKIENLSVKYQIDDFYKQKFIDTINVAKQTQPADFFDKTHGYYLAVIQGFFRTYYYTRGSAFSFLIQEKPHFEKYTTDWKKFLKVEAENPILNRINENYSSGVYMTLENVTELLLDYKTNEKIKNELNEFYSHKRINVLIKALEYAKENKLGLLEATEVIEPNPMELNESTCYSNLFNCDREGALLYEEATLEQIKQIEEQNNLEENEILSKAKYTKVTPNEVNQNEKKGFWKKLFGK